MRLTILFIIMLCINLLINLISIYEITGTFEENVCCSDEMATFSRSKNNDLQW